MKQSIKNRAFAAPAVVVAALTVAAGAGYAVSELAPPAEQGKQIADDLNAQRNDPAAMQRWMESGMPGKPHQLLATFVGEWDTTMKMWMDPAAEPMVSTGTSVVTSVLGGRFTKEDFKSEVMGQPYEGLGLAGYDNVLHQFTSVWADSMNTSVGFAKGSISPDGKTLTYIGEMNEPMTGEVAKAFMMKVSMGSNDRHVMELFEILYGEPFKVMEIEYTRKGG